MSTRMGRGRRVCAIDNTHHVYLAKCYDAGCSRHWVCAECCQEESYYEYDELGRKVQHYRDEIHWVPVIVRIDQKTGKAYLVRTRAPGIRNPELLTVLIGAAHRSVPNQ